MKNALDNGATPNEGDLCLVRSKEGIILVCEYIVIGSIEENFYSTETGKKINVDTWESIEC